MRTRMLSLVLIVNFFLIVRVYFKVFNGIHLEASKCICLFNLDLLFLRTIFAPTFNYLHSIRYFSKIIPQSNLHFLQKFVKGKSEDSIQSIQIQSLLTYYIIAIDQYLHYIMYSIQKDRKGRVRR